MKQNPDKLRKYLLIGGVIVLILVVAGGFLAKYLSGSGGTVELNLHLANAKNVSVKFNDEIYPVKKVNSKYQLNTGHYQVVVSRDGYKNFTTSFDLNSGQDLILNVVMQPKDKNNPRNSTANYSPFKIPLAKGVKIDKVHYFYNYSWAYVVLDYYGDTAIAIYENVNNTWTNKLGPGTSFTNNSIKNLPAQVKQYLRAKNYVGGS